VASPGFSRPEEEGAIVEKLRARAARCLPLGVAAGVLLGAVAWLLWPALHGSSVLVAADFLEVWPPWAAQLGDGGLPHNTDLSDNILYYLPSRQYAAAAVAEGRIPLWNPYILSGTPFLANGESGVFSPLNVLFYLCRAPTAFGYTAALQLLLAGTFMYALLRRLEVGWAGALFGGVVFMLNGFFVVWLEMLNLVGVALWIPLVVLATDRWMEKKSPGTALFLAGLVGLQFLVGFLQVSLYLLLAAFGYAALKAWRVSAGSVRHVAVTTGGLAAISLGGGALAAVQLAPHAELIAWSHREATPVVWQLLNPAHLRHLVTLAFPDYFGSPVGNTYRGAPNYTELCGYVGVLPLLAALAGARRLERPGTRYFILLALVALLVYLETPLNAVLGYVVPGYRLGIGSSRIVCLFTFAAAGLAGIGFDGLVRAGSTGRGWRGALAVLLFAGSLWDLLAFGGRHLTTVDEKTVYPPTGAVEFLRRTPGRWRMLSTPGVFPPNSAMAYGLDTIEGYESLFLRRYREYMTVVDASVAEDPNYHGIVLREHESPLLDLLNVRFVVTDQPLAADGLRLVYDEGVRIYERRRALPRAFVVWRYRKLADSRAVLDALRKGDLHPSDEALLTEEPGLVSGDGGGTADVAFDSCEAERVVLRARLSAPGLLVLGDAFYPGWEVLVDGVRRPLLVADYIVRAVKVEAGDHRVEFVFRPISFRLGAAISLLALAAGAAWWRWSPAQAGSTGGRRPASP
jgi:hypothetical protein